MGLKKYQIIYADPPWEFTTKLNAKTKYKEITDHYPVMNIEDVIKLPVKEIADKNCVLFLWVVHLYLENAMKVINNWGFRYITVAFEWLKLTENLQPVNFMSHWTTGGAIELCLLAKKGTIKRKRKDISKLIISKRGKHSVKPAIIRKKIVELVGDLPRIELFARQKIEGWDIWGNELKNDIELKI